MNEKFLRGQEQEVHRRAVGGTRFEQLIVGVKSGTFAEMEEDRELMATLESRGYPVDEDSCKKISDLFKEKYDPHEISALSSRLLAQGLSGDTTRH